MRICPAILLGESRRNSDLDIIDILTIFRQWKRVLTAAVTTSFNGAGGIAGAYIVRYNEAPKYPTAVWASIG